MEITVKIEKRNDNLKERRQDQTGTKRKRAIWTGSG